MLVEDIDGKILFTRRNPNMRLFPHAWVFPGGKLDVGEKLVSCATRELREETGIVIEESQ